jgi:hypothetical protein
MTRSRIFNSKVHGASRIDGAVVTAIDRGIDRHRSAIEIAIERAPRLRGSERSAHIRSLERELRQLTKS